MAVPAPVALLLVDEAAKKRGVEEMTTKTILAIAVWLARHNSRPSRAASRVNEPYVDLGPLDLTRRH
jgi:hypothetical protein